MHICLTCNSSPWSKYSGGGHAVGHNLAKQWSRMGHNVFMLYPAREKGKFPDDLNYRVIEVRDFGQYDRSLNVFLMLKSARKLVSQTPIDVVIGNADEAALLHFVPKRGGRPIFTMIGHHPYKIPYKATWDLSKPVRLLKKRVLYLQKYAFEHAVRVFSVSNFTKHWLVTTMGIPAEKIEVVYNGVASEFFDIPRMKIPPDEIVITTWGRLDPQKGADILLRCLPLVLEELSSANMKIHVNIAGQAPVAHLRRPTYDKRYKDLAESLGVADKVSFLGRISDVELRGLLSRTSLCVHPSRVEGFGLMVAESMAAGVPTISTNTSAIPEIITDGETGLLVPPENPEALAERILYAINNPSAMERIARAGRKKIKECFTWQIVAERYCAAFESLLHSG